MEGLATVLLIVGFIILPVLIVATLWARKRVERAGRDMYETMHRLQVREREGRRRYAKWVSEGAKGDPPSWPPL
jgi:FtsZ-interacting cell division protein ZipA